MRKYSPLLEKYNCLKCGSHVCQKCAYKVSQPDPITLCKECWDIAICYCKTGDWFNQYLESKLPNPLRIDITFTPLQTSNLKASFDQLPEEESTWRRETSALLFKESKCCFKIEDEESNKNHNISSSDKSPRKQIQETVLHDQIAEALKSSKETVKSKQLTKSPPSSPFRRPTLLPSKTFAFMNKPSLLTRDTDDAKESFKGKHHGAEVDGTKSGTESSKSENSGNFSAVDESQGEIDVSMEYNVQGNQLAIMLWALRNLTIRKRILGILHSTIRLLPENTKYDLKLPHPEKRNGLYSNYLRSVCFLVHTSDLNKKMVLIQIWFKKGITYNMILGHKQTFHLFKGKDSISNVPLNSTYYGEIKVALRFAISVNQKRMVRIAEEAIDLCGTLEVWIKEGMNLISPISGRDVNLFVTVSLTDGNENTEYRSTDCVQRSDQPFWNSILRFSNQHLSDIYESKLKITIWNRINSFKPAEQLGVVKICTKGREYDFKTLLTADDDEGVSQCSTKKSNASLWEAVQSKPGTWVEQILKVHAPISK
ncbi:unnamed protein product [Heterobilharzia americana]|nr:unnamed protein product [Heterobilharzia americana]